MDKNKIYQVKNRSASVVVYNIPEDNIRREFSPGEPKKITFGELEKLSYQPGGRELMANYLLLRAEELTDAFNIPREVEYDMSEEQIVELLRTGSQDAFLDALDFAPIGVIDLIKKFAVSLPLSDLNKIMALKEKTGFDVTKALAAIQAEREEEKEEEQVIEQEAPKRRVQQQPKQEGRRTTTQYKVVSENS